MKVAGIEQELQFIGMDNTIEIWSPEKLKETLKSEEEFGIEFENIMNVSDNL
jgi:MraZ protein